MRAFSNLWLSDPSNSSSETSSRLNSDPEGTAPRRKRWSKSSIHSFSISSPILLNQFERISASSMPESCFWETSLTQGDPARGCLPPHVDNVVFFSLMVALGFSFFVVSRKRTTLSKFSPDIHVFQGKIFTYKKRKDYKQKFTLKTFTRYQRNI